MSIFNDSSPADTEAVRLGASRIRETKTTLNTLLSQIFNDSLAFLSKWITGDMIQNDPTVDADRAITSDHLKIGSVLTEKLADGVLSADVDGRAKMAGGYIVSTMLDPGFTIPSGAIPPGAVNTSQLANNAATIAKVGSGVAKIAVGSYAGSSSATSSVSGLAFAPNFILIVPSTLAGTTGTGNPATAFLAEATGLPAQGPIHVSTFALGALTSGGYATAIQWNADGFTILLSNKQEINKAATTYYFLALRV